MFRPTPRCSRSVLAATLGGPASPVLPTCVTGRAPAASRSSYVPQRGLVPGRLRRTAQPASASPDRLPVPHTHPAGAVRLVVGHLLSNLVRLGATCTTAAVRSPARG